MKKTIIVIVSMFMLTGVQAQDFEKGGNYVSIGYGLDPWGHPGLGNAYGKYKKTTLGPIIAGYEYGLTDVVGIGRFGVGGEFMQSWYTQKYKGNGYENVHTRSRFSFVARVAYHFEFNVPKMDVYAGAGLATHVYTDREKYLNPAYPFLSNDEFIEERSTRVGVGHYVFAGIRYYFTETFGVYAEGGHGASAIRGGVVFAF